VAEVYGIDIDFDESQIPAQERHKYQKAAAEEFSFDKKFDVIFAGDLIEHLTNPGLFLENAKRHLSSGGRLIITTPNAFNLFNIAGKITRPEPVVNSDHTFYFNRRTIEVLLNKCGWNVAQFGFMYTLGYEIKESPKKKVLNVVYRIFSYFTPKYYETLVVIAELQNKK
jgi:2-polyprenyl-3-methyl-5-hydroxy-6-metoxy-1,4-benzoquinol methylase